MNAIEKLIPEVINLIHTDCNKILSANVCNKIDTVVDDLLYTVEREIGIMMDLFGITPFVTVVSSIFVSLT